MYQRRDVDFKVQWQGNIEDTTIEIFDHLFVRRIKAHKPCVINVVGASGEGKSNVALHLIHKLFQKYNLDFRDYVKNAVVGGIEDFGPKTKKILYSKDMKKCFALVIDEASATVNSKDWASLTNKAVNFINNMSRAIKPLMIFLVAQSIKQVDSQTRHTINYYMKITRPLNKPARAKIYKFVISDKDLDKPKLQKRIVKGTIEFPNGKKELYELNSVEFPKVNSEVWEIYEKDMLESKNKLLENEFDKLAKHLLDKNEDKNKERADNLSKWLVQNKHVLNNFSKFTRNKWKLSQEFAEHFGVTDSDKKYIEKALVDLMKKENKIESYRSVRENDKVNDE